MKKLYISKKYLIQKYIKEKKTMLEIAKNQGCSYSTIQVFLKQYHILTRTASEAKLLMSKWNNILTKKFFIKEYITNKKSQTTIAKEVGCSQSLICRYFKKYNISSRTLKEVTSGELNGSYKDGRTMKIYYCKEPGCNKKIATNTALYHTGFCLSCSMKGKRSWRYGKPASHGQGQYYKNIYMRSSWEIAYAKYLDSKGIKWQYESKAFELKLDNRDCTYTPDFYLPETDEYIEIKGRWREDAKEKFKLFKEKYSEKNIKLLMQKQLIQMGVL